MSFLPVRCKGRYKVGDRMVERGCGAVRLPQADGRWDWCFAPNMQAQDGTLCDVCAPLLEAEQKRARIRGEQGVARRCAKGFGPGEGDPFRQGA